MAIAQHKAKAGEAKAELWLRNNADVIALFVLLTGFLARLWAASGTFLNPDEALHFRLANQPSLLLAYRASLTNSHPPLLFLLLHLWQAFGTSEICLRLPSVIAGTAFCWIFFRWLAKAAGELSGFIGLLFAAWLLPVLFLSAEIRQYALLCAFLMGAVYSFDKAFEKNSSGWIALFTLCLCLAGLSQYSGFLLIIALGFYALFRIFTERPSTKLLVWWAVGQLVVLGLAGFLYKTHLSKLAATSESHAAVSGWLRDFIPHSYFDPAHDNPIAFVLGHSFGVFQYFFGQLAVGDLMGLLFLIALVFLLRGKGAADARTSRQLGIFLFLSFAVGAVASLIRVYPYGGSRHVAYLLIPAMTGVSVMIARMASGRWLRGIAIAALMIAACLIFGKQRQPWIRRADQQQSHMRDAIAFIEQNVAPSELIFTDYQSDLTLGHYLCAEKPIVFESAPANYERFSCNGHQIVSRGYKRWQFRADDFPQDWQSFVQLYGLKRGDTVWIAQAGWGITLPEDLRRRYPQFSDLYFESFGDNIKIFKLTVG
jgi:Dolichyl-phosphate-mannose-protein mannosyltransferase